MSEPDQARSAVRRVNLWAASAGFGLAGLFDGIVLHRLLHWHHLLSTASPHLAPAWHLRADALFDAVMYATLAAALTGALADRATVARISPRCVVGMALNGFGAWHVVDTVVVHWLLGLHRVRPLADVPLLWDIGWLAVFGLMPLVIGYTMRETTEPRNEPNA